MRIVGFAGRLALALTLSGAVVGCAVGNGDDVDAAPEVDAPTVDASSQLPDGPAAADARLGQPDAPAGDFDAAPGPIDAAPRADAAPPPIDAAPPRIDAAPPAPDAAVATPDDSNWDFEEWGADPIDDFAYVTGSFTVTQETSTVHGGGSAAKLMWTSATNQDLITTWAKPATSGTSYTCSVYAYDNDPAGRIRVGLQFTTGDGTPTSWPTTDVYYSTDQDGWQLITWTATAPATTQAVKCIIRMYDVDPPWVGAATAYLDDLGITP